MHDIKASFFAYTQDVVMARVDVVTSATIGSTIFLLTMGLNLELPETPRRRLTRVTRNSSKKA